MFWLQCLGSKNTQVSIASLLEKDADVDKLRGKSSRRSSKIHHQSNGSNISGTGTGTHVSHGSVPVFTSETIKNINENDGGALVSPNDDAEAVTTVQSLDDAILGGKGSKPSQNRKINEMTPINSEMEESSKDAAIVVSPEASTSNANNNNNNNNIEDTASENLSNPKHFQKVNSTSAYIDGGNANVNDRGNSNSSSNNSDANETDAATTTTTTRTAAAAAGAGATVSTTEHKLSEHINDNEAAKSTTNTKLKGTDKSNLKAQKSSTVSDRRAMRALSAKNIGNLNINVSEVDNTSSNLRNFQSPDGTQYTEIEVSILSAGHYFGETSLMDEEDLDEEDENVDFSTMTETEKAEYLNKRKQKQKEGGFLKGNSSNTNTPAAAASTEVDQKANESASDLSRAGRRSQKRRKSNRNLLEDEANTKRKKVKYKGSAPTFRCKTNCVVFSIEKAAFEDFFRLVPSARPWFNIMLSRYNVEMDTVLLIPKATRYFTLFLESEYAEENIHFYLAVCDFKESFAKAQRKDLVEMATLIGEVFISTTAEQQINIAGSQRKALLNRIKRKDITVDMFDQSQKSIHTLLERDWFVYLFFFYLFEFLIKISNILFVCFWF